MNLLFDYLNMIWSFDRNATANNIWFGECERINKSMKSWLHVDDGDGKPSQKNIQIKTNSKQTNTVCLILIDFQSNLESCTFVDRSIVFFLFIISFFLFQSYVAIVQNCQSKMLLDKVHNLWSVNRMYFDIVCKNRN